MENGKNTNTSRTEEKTTEWAFDRIKEAFEQVAKDEARKLSTVQEIMIRSAEYLRRIIAPAGRQGGVDEVIFVPALYKFLDGRLRTVGLWVKNTRTGGVRSASRR